MAVIAATAEAGMAVIAATAKAGMAVIAATAWLSGTSSVPIP